MSNQPKRHAALLVFSSWATPKEIAKVVAYLATLDAVSETRVEEYEEDMTEPHLYFP